MLRILYLFCLFLSVSCLYGTEFHVSPKGDDANAGTPEAPFRSIQRAADLAQPGDVVTVHEGVYRERVNPPRGGESDEKRIVYQAVPGEKVEIKGSEVVKNWTKIQNDTWKTTVPNSLFGDFNPFTTPIQGDWFNPKGRIHHVGAVYLDGHWLIEAAVKEDVQRPFGSASTFVPGKGETVLLNVAWLQPGNETDSSKRRAATSFSANESTKNAPCDKGGDCVGWIKHGSWLQYDQFDFGEKTEIVTLRSASASSGGVVELCLDEPDGEIIGSCTVPYTGGWQAWRSFPIKIKPMSGKKNLFLTFRDSMPASPNAGLWFAEVNDAETTIWAQFRDIDPNERQVEINVRQSVFYPEQPGRNYITVRGFVMRHAATPWAPPTAEQIGLIGTHWSKGWIIEDNTVSHSICTGITLGKHGDEFDNTSANTSEGYVETIRRAHAFRIPWTRDTIGHHIVRNNTISHCEQAGIVGSMGAAFCTVTDNTIHDIHIRRLFAGAEMAGIKFHGAIDTLIARNHIYQTCRALWLDWMTQGTRVSSNLFHDNGLDLYVEVNHGPFLVDNNIMVSTGTIVSNSRGGAYVHNLFAGIFNIAPFDKRLTPFHKAHSTEVAGLHNCPFGDDRYYNNVFIGSPNLEKYDNATYPVAMSGNVFLFGAKPSQHEVDSGSGKHVRIAEKADGFHLDFSMKSIWGAKTKRKLITTEMLGKTVVSKAGFENPDGSPLRIDTDYFGKPRSETDPTPGPFENPLEEWILPLAGTAKE